MADWMTREAGCREATAARKHRAEVEDGGQQDKADTAMLPPGEASANVTGRED